MVSLTEDASSNTFITSPPKHPSVVSPSHLRSNSPRPSADTPKHLASWHANLASCISYLRRKSSSGKRRRKTVAVVPCGRGEYLCRNSVIHLLRIRSVVCESVERFRVVRGGTLEISRSKDTKLSGQQVIIINRHDGWLLTKRRVRLRDVLTVHPSLEMHERSLPMPDYTRTLVPRGIRVHERSTTPNQHRVLTAYGHVQPRLRKPNFYYTSYLPSIRQKQDVESHTMTLRKTLALKLRISRP